MKKISFLLGIIYIFLLYYLSSDIMKVILSLNFGLYILLDSLFVNNINNNRYIYSRKKLFLYFNLFLLGFNLLFGSFSYYLSNFIHIEGMGIYSLSTCLFLTVSIIFRYLEFFLSNYKIGKYLNNWYYCVLFIINIILCLILKNRYDIMFLYISSFIILVVTYILIYLFNFKYKKDDKELNHNYFKDIKKMILNDKNIDIMPCFVYISIAVLYFVLVGRYNYDIASIGKVLSDTYLFGLLLICIIHKLISRCLNIDFDSVINNYNYIVNRVLNVSLNACMLLFVISWPLSKVIFYSEDNFIFGLIILLFFYILFDYSIKMGNSSLSYKKVKLSILVGLFIKIIFEVPFINSVYRMGYNLSLGGILSSSLGMLVTTFMIMFLIIHKYKISIINNFSNVLTIIYNNIIYLLVLVLFSLIVKVDSDKYFINILVIIFYLFISFIFNFIRKRLKK